MGNTADATVNLNVTGGAPPDNTWKACETSANTTDGFWYKFSGGNTADDDGTIEFDVDSSGNGNKFVDIQLICADGWDPSNPTTSQGYRITGIPIHYDTTEPSDKQDISIHKADDPRCWQLKDKNTDEESGEFKVIVSYTGPGENPAVTTDIECDPAWRNKK